MFSRLPVHSEYNLLSTALHFVSYKNAAVKIGYGHVYCLDFPDPNPVPGLGSISK